MATIQVRRSRHSFLLLVADEDNGRFAIEGPMTNDQPWIAEILRAKRAGRSLTCWSVNHDHSEIEAAAREWEKMTGKTWWPQGSIVAPELAAGARPKDTLADASVISPRIGN